MHLLVKWHRLVLALIVAFVPLTPFSALLVWPLTFWSALTAKHIWIIFNLVLLSASALLLRSLTALEWRRIVILMVVTFPLHKNLLYRQYYILLLLIFIVSLWLYLHENRLLAAWFWESDSV